MKSISIIKPQKAPAGFTLVEVVIVVIVIVILTSLSAVGMGVYLRDSRDSQRTAQVKVLTEALEKYYNQNGEYPTCAVLSNANVSAAATVLGGVDEAAFKAPNAPDGTENSINCGSTDPTDDNDFFRYVAPASGTSSPEEFQIRYWSEGDHVVKMSNSRRVAEAMPM